MPGIRSHRGRLRSPLVLIAAALLCLAACGAQSGATGGNVVELSSPGAYSPQRGSTGGTLTYADWEGISNWDEFLSGATTLYQAESPIWANLWTFGNNMQPVPDLVTQVPTVQNGMVTIHGTQMDITIQLKSGLRWSDGSPLTTSDVRFTADAMCDPDSGASTAPGLDQVAAQQILSPTRMVWQLDPVPAGHCGAPAAIDTGVLGPYLMDLDMSPLPQHALGSIPIADWKSSSFFTERPDPTDGPYEVTSFTAGNNTVVTYEPNRYYADGRSGARYFGHKPYLHRLVYKTYGDKASELAGIRTGDTQIGQDLLGSDLSATKSIKGVRTVISYPPSYEMVQFNLGNNESACAKQDYAQTCGTPTVFKGDPVLRQALNLAVDKQAMINSLVGGVGRLMNGPFPDNLRPWYDTGLPAWRYDVARANRMLTADGWKMGRGGVREKRGRPLRFTISTTTGNPQRIAEEEQLRHDWAQVGADVTAFTNEPASQLVADFGEGGTMATGQYDTALLTSTFGADPDSWATQVFPSQIATPRNPGGQNWSFADDPTLTRLFTEGELTASPSRRRQIYDQVQVAWNTYLPWIPLYQRPSVATAADSVLNFEPGAPLVGGLNTSDMWNIADYALRPTRS